MPTTELLTLILSIVAIVFAVVAIVFEVSFFVLQRNEARTLTKNVQDLVFQAVRNEKGIDQLSGQTMRLIERLVEARVSVDRAQTAPEVEKIVADLLMPVQESIAELDKRMKGASQSEGIKREMDEELEELGALRKQISEVAREAAERTSRRTMLPGVPGGAAAEFAGEAAGSLASTFARLALAGEGVSLSEMTEGLATNQELERDLDNLAIAEQLGLVNRHPSNTIQLTGPGRAALDAIRGSLSVYQTLRDVNYLAFDSRGRVVALRTGRY